MVPQLYTGRIATRRAGGSATTIIGNQSIKLDIPFEEDDGVVSDFNYSSEAGVVRFVESSVEKDRLIVSFQTTVPTIVNFTLKVTRKLDKLMQDYDNFAIVKQVNNIPELVKSFKTEFVFHKRLFAQFSIGNTSYKSRIVSLIYPDVLHNGNIPQTKALVYIYQTIGNPTTNYYFNLYLVDSYTLINESFGNELENVSKPFQMTYNTGGFNQNYSHWVYDIEKLNLLGRESGINEDIEIMKVIVPSFINETTNPTLYSINVIGKYKNKRGPVKVFNSVIIFK